MTTANHNVALLCVTILGFGSDTSAWAAPKAAPKIVYSFKGGTDGAYPQSGVISAKNGLYGTTFAGGTGGCTYFGTTGCGTVFEINPKTGAEKVIYSFTNGNDGGFPIGSLLYEGGALYGTTNYGKNINGTCGGYGCGTVFSVDPKTGAEFPLHQFGAQGDGSRPYAALIYKGGELYGTTEGGGGQSGGASAVGTVFSLNVKTGAENILFAFYNGEGLQQGEQPQDTLLYHGGLLLGTTYEGGTGTSCQNGPGCGLAFSINVKSGVEQTVHNFTGGSDGNNPIAGMIYDSGAYYGTTTGGAFGSGVVYKINAKTGDESIVYPFKGGSDGANPEAGVILHDGVLYGTTANGGGTGCGGTGCGTIFSIDLSKKKESVLYAFTGGADGGLPYANLFFDGSLLYGTTSGGGAGNVGTVFSIAP